MAARAALVTGGSSGIGKALARVLGQEGHAVTISGATRRSWRRRPTSWEARGRGGRGRGRHGRRGAVAGSSTRTSPRSDGWTPWSTPPRTAAAGFAGAPLDRDARPPPRRRPAGDVPDHPRLAGMLTAAGRRARQGARGQRLLAGGQGRDPGDVLLCGREGGRQRADRVRAGRGPQRRASSSRNLGRASPRRRCRSGRATPASRRRRWGEPADLAEGLRFLLRTSPTCLVREIEFTPPAQREIIERLVAFRSRAAAGSLGPTDHSQRGEQRSRSSSSFHAPTDARTHGRPGGCGRRRRPPRGGRARLGVRVSKDTSVVSRAGRVRPALGEPLGEAGGERGRAGVHRGPARWPAPRGRRARRRAPRRSATACRAAGVGVQVARRARRWSSRFM